MNVASKYSNLPLTLLMSRWRTLNETSQCEGSMVQVPAGIFSAVMVMVFS